MSQPVFIAAASFELDSLRQNFRSRYGDDIETRECGVGALEAAKSARKLAATCADRDVVFVGTCGTFGAFAKPYLVRPQKVAWLPCGVRRGFSYLIEGSAPELTLPAPGEWAQGLPEVTAVCSSSISLVPGLPPGFERNATVENLELYSCIGEIAETARTVSVVLGVTNGIAKDAHSQWKRYHSQAAALTAEFLVDHLPNPHA